MAMDEVRCVTERMKSIMLPNGVVCGIFVTLTILIKPF